MTASLNDEYVTVRVVGNGPGIPESERGSVFAEAQTLDSNSGTGFGLYLVEMLVDAYDGDVWVEDAGERIDLGGAAFIVELEVVEKQFP